MIEWMTGGEARAFLCVWRGASLEGACSWKVVDGACFELQFGLFSSNSTEKCRFHTKKKWASHRETVVRQGFWGLIIRAEEAGHIRGLRDVEKGNPHGPALLIDTNKISDNTE